MLFTSGSKQDKKGYLSPGIATVTVPTKKNYEGFKLSTEKYKSYQFYPK